MARNLAWQDSQNPFAKRVSRRTGSDLERAERAEPALYRANTDDPVDYALPQRSRRSNEQTGEDGGVHHPIRPDIAKAQDAVGDTEIVASPSASLNGVNGKSETQSKPSDINDTTNSLPLQELDGGVHKARIRVRDKIPQFLKLSFGKRQGSKREEDDDNDNSKPRQRFTFASQVFAILEGGTFVYAWKYTPLLSLLYLAIPVGFVVNYTHQSPTTVFAVNLVAILPSGALLSLAVEELGLRVGEIISGLLNATFSNAAQLISSILLLRSNQVALLRSSLLGAILSNLLFMTGIGFLFGGIGRLEQYFHQTLAQTLCCLLMLAVLSLIIPSAAHYLSDMTEADIIKQSRGISVVILISYVLWLFFQLHTNRSEFDVPEQLPPKIDEVRLEESKRIMRSIIPTRLRAKALETETPSAPSETDEDEAKEAAEPKLSLFVAIGATIISLVLLWFNTDFATNSVQGMLQQAGVSQTFVGVAILPLLSNDWNMPLLARQNRMQMLLELTIEKSMQTALAIIPIVVLVGWGIGVDFTLEFNGFVIAATFAAMVMVSYVVQEGKSNWLVGALLIKVYVIISIAAYFIND